MIKFNYDIEIKNIIDKIYENKIYDIAAKNEITNIDIDLFKSTNVYLGSDMDSFIISLIPRGNDGYYFRCMIANKYNYTYPKLYDYLGNPLKNANYSKFAIQLWEDHVNEMLIEAIRKKFNTNDFYKFVDDNLYSMSESILKHVEDYKNNKTIVIPFTDKNLLLSTIKEMILNGKLDMSWAQLIVNMDNLRKEMVKFSVSFSFYNEFDKLEDDLEFCLNNFCKYSSSDEIYDVLVNCMNFSFIEGVGLVKN